MTSPALTVEQPVETVPPAPAPGWTSSEFLSTMAVHLLNLLAILLDLLHVHWSKGLSSMQALIPMVALTISAVLQAGYANRRTALKIEHVAKTADVRVEQIKQAAAIALPAEAVAGQLVPTLQPALDKISAATRELTAALGGTSDPQTVVVNTSRGEDALRGAPDQQTQELSAVDPTVVTDPRQ